MNPHRLITAKLLLGVLVLAVAVFAVQFTYPVQRYVTQETIIVIDGSGAFTKKDKAISLTVRNQSGDTEPVYLFEGSEAFQKAYDGRYRFGTVVHVHRFRRGFLYLSTTLSD